MTGAEINKGVVERLEDLLSERTRGKNGEAFYTQWMSDKAIISRSLQAIGQVFPHYSLHDESHCKTILNNIVCIVGEEQIYGLSASDIWLLLSAVYFHDTGMIVSDAAKMEIVTNGSLRDWIQDIKRDKNHEFYKDASYFEIENNKIRLNQTFDVLAANAAFTNLISEIFRKEHGMEARKNINNKREKAAMGDWNNQQLLPNRFYDILVKVCESHTKDFSSVLELPFKQTGYDNEEFHPRFIAAMLRMGDVLDVDHKRFSEAMLGGLHNIPRTSVWHYKKHASITRFNLRGEIEIIANTDGLEEDKPDVAYITRQWFDWIKKEYKDQSFHWAKIAPDKNFILPGLGNLSVESATWVALDNYHISNFNIDPKQGLLLLKGSGLYKDNFSAIREILQNAVDATILRMWYERKKEFKDLNPTLPGFKDIVKDYPITVDISGVKESDDDYPEDNNNLALDEKDTFWRVTITDKGIGFNLDGIMYLANAANSKTNHFKKYLIDEMPAWLRPSGAFGIGFQSAYMLTDKVSIKSKSAIDGLYLEADLHSPESGRGIRIKKPLVKRDFQVGTELSFVMNENKIENFFNVSKAELVANYYNEFDPILVDKMPVCNLMILNCASKFSEFCWIELNSRLVKENLPQSKFIHYINKPNVEFSILPTDDLSNGKLILFFNGQPLSKPGLLGLPGLILQINLLGRDAREYLSINREEILKPKIAEVEKIIEEIIMDFVNNHTNIEDKINESNNIILQYISLFCNCVAPYLDFNLSNFYDYVNGIVVRIDQINSDGETNECEVTIDNIISNLGGGFKIGRYMTNYPNEFYRKTIIYYRPDIREYLIANKVDICDYIFNFLVLTLRKKYKDKFGFRLIGDEQMNSDYEFVVTEFNIQFIEVRDIYKFVLEEYTIFDIEATRKVCVVFGPYFKLALKISPSFYGFPRFEPEPLAIFYQNEGAMLLPNYSKAENTFSVDDPLYEFVYKHRRNENTTMEDIKATYKLLCDDLNAEAIRQKENNKGLEEA